MNNAMLNLQSALPSKGPQHLSGQVKQQALSNNARGDF